MNRRSKTLPELEAERAQRQQRQADYLKELRQQVFAKRQERDAEAAEALLEAHRERHPRPPALDPHAAGHAPAAPDSRLGMMRRNPKARPLTPPLRPKT